MLHEIFDISEILSNRSRKFEDLEKRNRKESFEVPPTRLTLIKNRCKYLILFLL